MENDNTYSNKEIKEKQENNNDKQGLCTCPSCGQDTLILSGVEPNLWRNYYLCSSCSKRYTSFWFTEKWIDGWIETREVRNI